MSYDNYYKRRGGKEKSRRGRSRDLDNTINSRALFNCNTSVRQVWMCEPENENGSFSSCPIHGPSQRVWRLVGQDSRESHAIFEHGYKPPCPVHNPKASVGSVNSSGCINTAILDDEIITVEPEPRQDTQLSRNRPRCSHSRSKQSLVNSIVERPSSKRSMCSIRSNSQHRSSISSIGERLEATLYANSLWTFLKNFCQQYPRPAMALGFLLFLYFFIHQLDFTIAHILECIIRFVYPFSHYIAVTNEQFFARLSRMATRSDEMMEAVYCDFALSWCQRFGLMCEVQCSFVEQSLQRIRKHPH